MRIWFDTVSLEQKIFFPVLWIIYHILCFVQSDSTSFWETKAYKIDNIIENIFRKSHSHREIVKGELACVVSVSVSHLRLITHDIGSFFSSVPFLFQFKTKHVPVVNIQPQWVSDFISSDPDCLLFASWSKSSGRASQQLRADHLCTDSVLYTIKYSQEAGYCT